jgi:hypothetical protein
LLPRGAFGFSTGFVGDGLTDARFIAAVPTEPLGIGFAAVATGRRGFGLAITFGFTGLFIGMLLTLLG